MNKNVPSVKGELLREAWSWIKTILFALIFAWIFTNFVIVNASVPTGSMETTIRVNDRIVAFRLSYLFSNPKRNDIIVFRSPDYVHASILKRIERAIFRRVDDSDLTLYVKRIIGMPGDTLYIHDGLVYINDAEEPLEEDFALDSYSINSTGKVFPIRESTNSLYDYITVPEDGSHAFITVPEGHYFVLGDNRGNSQDSRAWGTEGTLRAFVPHEHIQGKVILRYFPGFRLLTK